MRINIIVSLMAMCTTFSSAAHSEAWQCRTAYVYHVSSGIVDSVLGTSTTVKAQKGEPYLVENNASGNWVSKCETYYSRSFNSSNKLVFGKGLEGTPATAQHTGGSCGDFKLETSAACCGYIATASSADIKMPTFPEEAVNPSLMGVCYFD